jgi:hypothetical protein
MDKPKKSKEDRRRDKEIVEQYHQKLTEDALEPLFNNFLEWKVGKLPYYELTEYVHEFHKKNQQIWSMFNYHSSKDEFFLLRAKKELGLLTEEEKEQFKFLDFDY